MDVVGELCHGSACARESTNDPVVGRVVQHTRHVSLPSTERSWVTIKNFSDGVDFGGIGEAGPETLIDSHGTVKSQTIDGVVGNQLCDPLVHALLDIIVLGA